MTKQKQYIKKHLCVLILMIACMANLQAQINLTDKVPVDPKVKIGKLANGLTYYIRQNKKPENKVELRLVVNAGSILEDNDQQGLAHFNEHMAFNGSTHFKKNELVNFLQSIGVQFGADLNAYTGFDETVYILPIPLTDHANFKKGFQVLQDWATNLSFENEQIDGERPVVLEESRLGKGANDRMFRKIYPIQYAGSKYAERLPIGKDSILKHFKYDAAKRFYRDWYRPNLMAVIVVGDVDPTEAEATIKEYFAGLKNPANERPRENPILPPYTKNQAIVVTDKEATTFSIELSFSAKKGTHIQTVGDYRKQYLVRDLYSSLLNQRLQELTQSANPPFLYAFSSFGSLAKGYEGLNLYAAAGKNGPDTALFAIIGELERVKKFGFTEAELERGKKQIIAGEESAYNDKDKTESKSFVEEYIRNFLEKEPIPGIETEYKYAKEILPTVKLSEVNSWSEELRNNDKFIVSLQGPSESKFKLPTKEEFLATATKAFNTKVSGYEEGTIASELIKSKPQAGKILSEKKNELLGTTELTFANGAKVVLKPTTFKEDDITLTSFHKGGTNKLGVEDKYNGNYAAQIVQQCGIGDFSPVDLRKFLSGKVATASPRISPLSAGITGSSNVKDFETLLQLTYLYITNPRKDEALFNGWKEKSKASVQFIMSDPSAVFTDTVYKTLYNNSPLSPVILPKASYYDQVDMNKAIAIYQSFFADANEFTFIFTGNVDVEKVKPLLATYIGSLPGTSKPATLNDNGLRFSKGAKDVVVKKGTEAKSMILNIYNGEVPYSEDLALKTEMLAEVLNIKIIEELREKMGGIYGGGMRGSVTKFPYSYYSLSLQLPCGPENVEKLKAAADEEIEKIKKEGPQEKDLEKVKKTRIEKYKTQIKENNYWSNSLLGIYFSDNDPKRMFDYEKIVNGVSIADIKQTAQTLFDGKNVIKAVLFPEK